MQDHIYHQPSELPEIRPGHVAQDVALVLRHGSQDQGLIFETQI